MNDKLVYDLSLETEGTPNVFIRKDWINMLDNQNGNYQGNQSVIDTSQISNSNKFINYREGYLAVPLLLSAELITANTVATNIAINDGALGLKNWFGNIIHSLTIDYNGSTVIQQTNFINMWNSFKLLTSLSYDDILMHGSTIGFYPDTPDSVLITDKYISNNNLERGLKYTDNKKNQYQTQSYETVPAVSPSTNPTYNLIFGGNKGLTERIKNINFNPTAFNTYNKINTSPQDMRISNISGSDTSTTPYKQVSVMAIIYLKHLTSFFNFIPLLKGAFFKITMNLNNASNTQVWNKVTSGTPTLTSFSSNVSSGGIQPLQTPSILTGNSWLSKLTGASGAGTPFNVLYNISVGQDCLDKTLTKSSAQSGNLGNNIYLYVPAYSFNPTFYESYISSSPKRVVYTDVYQYSVPNVSGKESFNRLITNGIPNIKSVLVIPFLQRSGTEQYLSTFDGAGAGSTAPSTYIKNFQVKVSGQNAIYNNQQYAFEEFNNQLIGCNAVNGALTDGLTSGFIDFNAFITSYCYYYVNVERMLPSEKSVPKSIEISGQMQGVDDTLKYTFMVFVEYEHSMEFDLQTGARLA